MTAKQIALRLSIAHFDRYRQVVIPNLTTFVWGEAGVVGLYPSGWMDEVEIKISKGDFRREFQTKAEKHDRLVRGHPVHRPCNDGFDPENPLHVAGEVWWDGKPHYFNDWTEPRPNIIRRFWFAMPLPLARELESEIPAHTGLLGMNDGGFFQRLKEAPKLVHSRKVTTDERLKLMHLAYQRYWDIRRGLSEEQAGQFESPRSRKATTTDGEKHALV